MDPVIVMVGRPNEGVSDIEVMPDIPAEELADAIAAAFGWDGTYDIQINGKTLGRRQMLAEVDAWDGSELLMVISNRPPRIKEQQKDAIGYRTLQVSSQTQRQADTHSSTPETEIPPNPNARRKPAVSEPRTHTLLSSPVSSKALKSLEKPDSQS